MEYIIIAIGVLLVILSSVIIIRQNKLIARQGNTEERRYIEQQLSAIVARQDALNGKINDDFRKIAQYLSDNSMQNEQKLENIRKTLSYSIARMSEENTRHLDSIRNTVDEKLQDTLDKKLNESFRIVSERLEQVYKGLGEMQNIASSVGDLKKVLSNVKTRGVLGEVQLGAIIEQILSPEQYDRNVATKKGSQANVEYAVKLPGDEYGPVWLPIDAKFPADAYANVVDAYERGDVAEIEVALRQLKDRLRSFAKDISTKYIDPPYTTDFAIMFLPFEGLYSEAVRMGMVEILQNEYKVNIAGPTTMAALLNSLQMGFKTLAIQKRSGEVWNVLGAVKTEFDSFATVLESAQRRINQANDDLDKLIGVRTRKIQRTLKDVEATTYEIKTSEEE
ncbi:MAG: DNA recombination protein RmuC [Clostridia bacterium]|nr:DNA recombination protein RmuC [Clostridia bacterium]